MSEPVTIAPTPVSTTDALGALSVTERSHWRLTGELPSTPAEARDTEPTPDASDDAADSSPAQPDGQAASTEVIPQPASEPGTPKKRNADSRKAELAAEIQTLLRQRDELKASLTAPRPTAPQDVSVASSPTPQPVSLEQVVETPDVSRPALTEGQFFEVFPDASYGQFLSYTARYETRAFAYQQQQAQQVSTQVQSYREKAAAIPKEALTALPRDVIDAKPVSLLGPQEQPGVWNYAVQEILDASDSAALVSHLVAHPEDVQAIAATRTPLETIRTVAQINARLSSSVPPQSVVKTTTSAPAPVETLGSKRSAPASEAQAAVAAGDFARYASVMNAREGQR